ncbi:histidine kinase [Fibrisoma montanum]|uniref:histidine kinase n=1 Tax=Fibrisoma montanum TaxID=2305895 RepID=A0A418MAC6_9BACT|nr:ATP-binding protein [Fibrisoma montanum]RIV23311.1 histidine kinase [Fibrisoma montanum]
MNQLDQQVARRLTRFYVIALTCIALLTVSGLLFIKQTINNLNDDGRVLNVAGRQRMLSQRLTKLTVLQIAGIPSADKTSFDSLLSVWGRTHVQLRNGTLFMEKDYAVRKSDSLNAMFRQLESSFQAMYRSFAQISNARTPIAQKQSALQVILREEPSYLRRMNDIVFRFDAESFARVKYLERVDWLLGAATLLTLFIEGLFIFRPVVKRTRTVIRRLAESEEALRLANNKLEATNLELERANRTLVDTRQELLQTTEEKYQLQRAEDTVRSAALLEGQEEERRRFARELHDGIGQMLTGLKLQAGKLKKGEFPDEKQRLRFEELCHTIQDIIQTTRQISHNLMPSVLGDFGLEATLQLLAEQTTQSSGSAITFEGTGLDARLPQPVEIGLYRIAQEALNNAVKYADARTIRIRLQRLKSSITLVVEDDGKGFSIQNGATKARNVSPTNGLDNMRTRARLLNGDLTISSKPKKGTKVMVKLILSDTTHS